MDIEVQVMNKLGELKMTGVGNWKLSNVVVVSQTGSGDASTLADGIALADGVTKTLILVDCGTYNETDLTLPASVSMVALGQGCATISGSSGTTLLTITGSSHIVGIDLAGIGSTGVLDDFIVVNGSLTYLQDMQIALVTTSTTSGVNVIKLNHSSLSVYLTNLTVTGATGSSNTIYGINLTTSGATAYVRGGTYNITSSGGVGANAASGSTMNFEGQPRIYGLSSALGGSGSFYGPVISGTDLLLPGTDLKGYNSGTPNIGSGTASEKFGHIYITGDIYARSRGDGLASWVDGYETWNEHFDGLSALPSGWAWAGAPFATPNVGPSYSNTFMFWGDTATNRNFLYIAHAGGTSEPNYKVSLVHNLNNVNPYGGVRLDDGTDNNYAEVLIQQVSAGTFRVVIAYNKGGAGRTTVNGSTQVYPFDFLTMNVSGTKWSNWNINALVGGPGLQRAFTLRTATATPAMNWTPTRQGVVTNFPTGTSWYRYYLDAFQGDL